MTTTMITTITKTAATVDHPVLHRRILHNLRDNEPGEPPTTGDTGTLISYWTFDRCVSEKTRSFPSLRACWNQRNVACDGNSAVL